jgi:hypothetical protein
MSISASTRKSFGRSSPVICFNWAKNCISFSKAYPQTRRCLLLAANPTWGHTWHTLTLSLTSRTLTRLCCSLQRDTPRYIDLDAIPLNQ